MTSPDAVGCTIGTNVYDLDNLMNRHQTLKVKLIDTAGRSSSPLFVTIAELNCRSGLGTKGTVSDKEASSNSDGARQRSSHHVLCVGWEEHSDTPPELRVNLFPS